MVRGAEQIDEGMLRTPRVKTGYSRAAPRSAPGGGLLSKVGVAPLERCQPGLHRAGVEIHGRIDIPQPHKAWLG